MSTITKSALNKAGDLLRINPKDTNALYKLSQWRASHAHPLSLAFNLIKKYTNEVGNHALYGQRLKRISSILHKLNRNSEMKLSRMQDIGGCRVILSDYDKVFNLQSLLKKSRSITEKDNYIHYPKYDGYRSIHLIYKCGSNDPEYSGLKVEIQLRTKLQHAWATTVEIVDIFENQNLKLGNGSEDWKEFFRLVSDEFARLEGLPVIDRQGNKVRLKELTDSLCVIDKLNSYRGTIKLGDTHPTVGKAEFSILQLNLDTHTGELMIYHDLESAKDEYLNLETNYMNNDRVNILMLRMSDVKQIKKTYPNYFADSVKFVETLQKIIA